MPLERIWSQALLVQVVVACDTVLARTDAAMTHHSDIPAETHEGLIFLHAQVCRIVCSSRVPTSYNLMSSCMNAYFCVC